MTPVADLSSFISSSIFIAWVICLILFVRIEDAWTPGPAYLATGAINPSHEAVVRASGSIGHGRGHSFPTAASHCAANSITR
ncbi:hypothetical protein ABZ532_30730 [Streptomyces sp. NPDC019396]|uniref:hypothetical protein n=1 Tax=Streptomyces sp. NPDC019396 TaxID=3154687 RepID=UPI0033EB527C